MIHQIGVGKHDITGPCVQVGFTGMLNIDQQGEGLQTRLFARAFIVADDRQNRVAIVVADLAMCTQAVKLEVVRRLGSDAALQGDKGPLYTDENLMITATHTHSGPGGYSHYLAYNASIPGFNGQNFECIINGIVESLRSAHASIQPGRIYLARGSVPDCGGNRSAKAYLNNPADERAKYSEDTDREMVLLKFTTVSGSPLGVLNWFAAHPTTMGEKNRLVSGDHKSIAASLFEKALSGTISAFANSCCGDQSPNTKFGSRPDGVHDIERALEIGQLQFQAAWQLFQSDGTELQGSIACRQAYVDMSNCRIEGTALRTWPAAMGYGMLNGSREDSEGFKVRKWGEGTTKNNFQEDFNLKSEILKRFIAPVLGVHWPDRTSLLRGYEEGHAEKPIVFHLGLARFRGVPLVPCILPVQMFKIGPLVILGHPGEMTTMAGRRMRDTVRDAFRPQNVDPVVIAAYANSHSGYTTTREEYAVQNYEGASTLFGPWTLDAYQQEQARVARAIRDDLPLASAVLLSISNGQILHGLERAVPDTKVPGLPFDFGDVEVDVQASCQRGQRASATFLGGYPNNDLRTGHTYLAVKRKIGGIWISAYNDHDLCTFFRWHPRGTASMITIDWDIPGDQVPGLYRIKYFGHYWTGFPKTMKPIEADSGEFLVR